MPTFEYIDELAECWPTERLREASKLWPDPLTWGWFVGARLAEKSPREQADIVAVAITHASRQRVPLWDRPGAVLEAFKALKSQEQRLALAERLGEALDAYDADIAARARAAAQEAIAAQEAAEAAAEAEAAERERLAAEAVERERREHFERLERMDAAERAEAERQAAELERAAAAEAEQVPQWGTLEALTDPRAQERHLRERQQQPEQPKPPTDE